MTLQEFQVQTQAMIDGLRIGECLELQNSEHHLMDSIAALGNIKLFIVHCDPTSKMPLQPYLLHFQSSNPSPIWQTWYQNSQCIGILVRQSDQDEIPELDPFKQKKILFDFEISDLESIKKKINFCEMFSLPYSFHLKEKKPSELIHKALSFQTHRLRPRVIDLPSSDFSNLAELETFQTPLFEQNKKDSPKFSIVIPHYNFPFFVTNVLRHLNFCRPSKDDFEILLVDDHSPIEQFRYIKSFIQQHLPQLSIQLFRWPKTHFFKNGVRVFRAGSSRNWGAHFAKGKFLFFLDADMLVPSNFFSELENSFQSLDVVQFRRLHIPMDLSTEATRYSEVAKSEELYVEESQYWNQLFEAERWDQLQDHWKFCCTYGLGLSRSLFQDVGRIRRNFIQYGFEDTDLGYRLARMGVRMGLNNTPLLHLSSKIDGSQNFWYRIKKRKQLRPMAKNFYALNLDPDLYYRFRTLVG